MKIERNIKKNVNTLHYTNLFSTFNSNYTLDFVMKSKNTIKISAHGLFEVALV